MRGGWPAELAEAYHTETGGWIQPGRIAKALSPVLKRWRAHPPSNPYDYSPDELLFLAFGRWMRSEKRKLGPEYLAREVGEFVRGPGI